MPLGKESEELTKGRPCIGIGRNIVSRGEWLWNPANFKRPAYCFAFEVEWVHHVILTLHIVRQYGGQGRRTVHVWWWFRSYSGCFRRWWENTKWLHESSEPGKCWMLYFWLEFPTNTLENVQNVSVNSHAILVFCIHRASKNSIKCADLLQYFNPSTFINCTWSQKQRKMTIKTSKSRTMFAYNRAFAYYIHCYATFCLLYVFLAQHFDYYIHCYALF